MLANTELKQLGKTLEEADTVLLFPHVDPDGDAVGSSAGLCACLRRLGKKAFVILDEAVPGYLKFLDSDMMIKDPAEFQDNCAGIDPAMAGGVDVCLCIDCCEEKRFAGRKQLFASGRKKLCIDHHRITECCWDQYYIDPEAAAAAQIIWRLIREMEWPVDEEIATALYTGIVTDTGCFQYSNTTPELHRIAADMMEYEVDINNVSVNVYQNIERESMIVRSIAIRNMEIVAGGNAAISKLSKAELESAGARPEHTKNVIEDLRSIEGVEAAAFLKEDRGEIRVSMRAKTDGNVAQIAEKFGGGGHVKAAGCTMPGPMEEAYALIRDELERVFG